MWSHDDRGWPHIPNITNYPMMFIDVMKSRHGSGSGPRGSGLGLPAAKPPLAQCCMYVSSHLRWCGPLHLTFRAMACTNIQQVP